MISCARQSRIAFTKMPEVDPKVQIGQTKKRNDICVINHWYSPTPCRLFIYFFIFIFFLSFSARFAACVLRLSHIFCLLMSCLFTCMSRSGMAGAQEPKKWNTRVDSGTRSASAASCARRRSAPSRSSRANKISTVPGVTRKNSQLAASNAPRYAIDFLLGFVYANFRVIWCSIFCCCHVKIITTGGVTYKNDPWHRECFTCTHCDKSLAGQRFTSKDEKPYCAECFGELFAKRCTACTKPITGEYFILNFLCLQ